MSKFLTLLFILLTTLVAEQKPNFIIILTDDQGYADLSCFGSETIKTPHIDSLAKSGIKLTSFYSASSVCTPSRAALLTGRMPKRTGMTNVLFPRSKNGLNPEEVTIAEMLKNKGYDTALIGKWHLGHQKKFMPMNHGFDYFYGMPYSNDMSISKEFEISSDLILNDGCTREEMENDRKNYIAQYKKLKNKMPMLRGNTIIEYPVDQRTITRKYTDEAVKFIKAKKDKPFFLYLAHTMPHKPLFVEDDRKGTSKGGIYGDIIEHIDWSVGEVIKTLKANGNFENTFILYTSDNGCDYNAGGSSGPLKGRKFNTWEGGQRVPAIISYPPKFDGGKTIEGMTSSLDIFQTVANLSSTEIPTDRVYDGYNLTDYLKGKVEVSPRNEFYYYYANSGSIDGVRVGDWKYILRGNFFFRTKQKFKPRLFNLKDDIGETTNLINQFPEKARELKKMMEEFDKSILNN
ncbi:MAG: sulfatase [Lentisphaeraceae bacterium]|nr:sulfatase [Lentisphaeraceae bacterium]